MASSSSSSIAGTPTILLIDGSMVIYHRSGADMSNMYETSQVQKSANELAQPSEPTYWDSSNNCYYRFRPLAILRTVPTLPVGRPQSLYNHHDKNQISQDYPRSIITGMSTAITSQHLLDNSNNTVSTSSTCKTQPDVQNPLPQSKSTHKCKIKASKQHNRRISEVTNSKSRWRKKCQCPNCSAKGGNLTRDSNGKRQHICHIRGCRRIYDKTLHLKRHLQWHYNGKKYVSCAHCRKSFTHKGYLIDHFKMHENTECKRSKFKKIKSQTSE